MSKVSFEQHLGHWPVDFKPLNLPFKSLFPIVNHRFMKKILVPFDFSPAAMHAYRFALDIAAGNEGEVIVLKVVDLTPVYIESLDANPYYINSMSILTELKQEARNDFEHLRRRIDTNVPVRFEVEQGTVSQTVLKAIHQHDADLVVMGTTGTEGISELLVGSNTEKIVRSSPVPVFAIHKAQKVANIRNIVFPTTIDLDQRALLEKVKALQRFFHARLHLLYIKTPYPKQTDKELNESLERFAEFYGLTDYSIHIRHEPDEEEGILKFASRLEYSIIAMATHGFTGLTHLILGSIAENIVNHTREAVWTYTLHEHQ